MRKVYMIEKRGERDRGYDAGVEAESMRRRTAAVRREQWGSVPRRYWNEGREDDDNL